MPSENLYISSRGGRYGAVGIPWLAAIAYARLSQKTLFHSCTNCQVPPWQGRYRQSVIHNLILQYSLPCELPIPDYEDLDQGHGWVWGICESIMNLSNNKPLPDILRETHLSQEFFKEFKIRSKEKGWSMVPNAHKSLLLHVRLGDVYNNPNGSHQQYIGTEKLISLLRYLQLSFPDHNLYIITAPSDRDTEICKDAINKSGVKCSVLGNREEEKDLWLMMNCDILIMSRSTFSLLAGLLHNGSQVYTYERWVHFNELVGGHPNETNKSQVFKTLDFSV